MNGSRGDRLSRRYPPGLRGETASQRMRATRSARKRFGAGRRGRRERGLRYGSTDRSGRRRRRAPARRRRRPPPGRARRRARRRRGRRSRRSSGSPRTIPAGPVPRRIASASTVALDDDPRPDGITRIRPATDRPRCGWVTSTIVPVSGSRPPQKLRGSSRTSAGPFASPGTRTRPFMRRPIGGRRARRGPPPRSGRSPRGCRAPPERRGSWARTTPTCRSRSSPDRRRRAGRA